MQETAKLTLNVDGKEQTIELPVITGSENEKAIDIQSLRAKTGYVALDPAFINTASTTSSITFLDGEKGILRYRGYPIEQLAEHSTILEVSYLLINGELPTAKELTDFQNALSRHTLNHEDKRRFYEAFPPDAHPMASASSVV